MLSIRGLMDPQSRKEHRRLRGCILGSHLDRYDITDVIHPMGYSPSNKAGSSHQMFARSAYAKHNLACAASMYSRVRSSVASP